MNSSVAWAKTLVRLILLSASMGLLMLVACQSSAAVPAEFNLRYSCLHLNLPLCLDAQEFADRVADRTDGRVQIEVISLSGLIRDEIGVLQMLKDGTLDLVEIQAKDFVAEDERALLDILDLLGLYRDYETQTQINEAIRKDSEGLIVDRSSGVVLGAQFYPSHYFFTKNPLRTAEDIRGLRIRSHNRLLEDLLAGIGAIPEYVRFGRVYPALPRHIPNERTVHIHLWVCHMAFATGAPETHLPHRDETHSHAEPCRLEPQLEHHFQRSSPAHQSLLPYSPFPLNRFRHQV